MGKRAVLDLPLTAVMRWEIAVSLQQVLHLYTVGNFLRAWGNPKNHKNIERVFDSPEQAQHAAATCATWLGVRTAVVNNPDVCWWWPTEEPPAISV
ncbi:MAG: hypothetical protein M3O30_13930 [Planctomycetota bacterium]|nr:hypothetical protein [Planctomycetota bacterium]